MLSPRSAHRYRRASCPWQVALTAVTHQAARNHCTTGFGDFLNAAGDSSNLVEGAPKASGDIWDPVLARLGFREARNGRNAAQRRGRAYQRAMGKGP